MKWRKKKGNQRYKTSSTEAREGEKERGNTEDGSTLEGDGESSSEAQMRCNLVSLYTHSRAEPQRPGHYLPDVHGSENQPF